jgi:DNA/RNA-binding domain of Phe-tRNA-synthetase-like protein
MAAWREACTAFGSKPSRTRNSAEALAERALSGAGLPKGFVPVAAGEEAVGHPDAGEVVRRDEAGVTRRRWNWRQGPRARLTEESTSAIFPLESLAPMPVADVEAAGAELAELLEKFSSGARIEAHAPA